MLNITLQNLIIDFVVLYLKSRPTAQQGKDVLIKNNFWLRLTFGQQANRI